MKISIVTAVYNGEKFIRRCVESVLSQKYTDFEYIIIDGSSTDKTLDIIKEFHDDRIRLVSEKDHGMYDALNKGLKMASGDIVCYINYDDYFLNDDVFEKYINIFLRSKHTDAVYSSAVFENEHGVRLIEKKPLKFKERYLLTLGLFFVQPTLFWRRKVMDSVGYFDLTYKVASDYDFFSRILLACENVYCLDDVTVGFLWEFESFGAQNSEVAAVESASIRDDLRTKVDTFPLCELVDRVVQKLSGAVKKVRLQ
ncbi:glycosyltransferase [Vibrio fluvialis]|nr:glycosyltransferase [Vibrio fluvialis]